MTVTGPDGPANVTIAQARRLAESGASDAALQCCEALLAVDPFSLPAIDLTLELLTDADNWQMAGVLAQTALNEGLESAMVRTTLGHLAKANGDSGAATVHFTRALEIDPSDGDSALRVAVLHLDADEPVPASRALMTHCQHRPEAPEGWLQAATVLVHFGQAQAAEPFTARYGETAPNGPERDHRLAALGAGPQPERQDASVVRAIFDLHAKEYDANLAAIGNEGLSLAEEALAALLGTRGDLVVLDAGCGTGLVGPALRPFAAHLSGVDLSPAILAEAKARGCYDLLAEADVTELPPGPERYDLIYCADVLTYLGDLSAAFASFANVLAPSGQVLASVEPPPPGKGPVHLTPSGRFAHSPDHIAHAASNTGFTATPLITARTLRREYGRPILCDLHLLKISGAT